MHIEKVNGFLCGVIDNMQDEYKNDTAEMLKDKNSKINYVAMYITKRNTIAFRSTKPDFSVKEIAEFFGGKGHHPASSCTLTEKSKNAFNLKI